MSGQLGITVHIDDAGYLTVDSVDQNRSAFACGLQTGDRIRTVDGRRVRTHRALVERILTGLDEGAALLQVLRDGVVESVMLRPLVIEQPDSLLYPAWIYPADDTLISPVDSVETDTTRD